MCGGVVCSPTDTIGKYGIYIVHCKDNLGFAKGNNLGVKFLSRNFPCEYILFSNDDIILEKGIDLQPMIKILDSNENIGAVGPAIVGLDGRHQSPHRTVVTAYRQIGWILFSRLRRKRTRILSNIAPTPKEGICYWVSGAFFLMKYSMFAAVSGFDPNTFLYSEEPILAERLKRCGKSMYFYPDLQVTHIEKGSTKNIFDNKYQYRMIVESNCLYYRKYLRTPSFIVSIYRFLSLRKIKESK